MIDGLVSTGRLEGTLRVPGAAGYLDVSADLRARQIAVAAEITAPTDRGNKARVTWLTRQLGADTPQGLVVEAWPRNARQPLLAPLPQAREDPILLVDPDRRDTLRFRLVLRSEMGQNRKDGSRSPGFIQSLMGLVRDYYALALQQVTPWTPQAPQSRTGGQPPALVDEPIEGPADLDEAISAAREHVAEEVPPEPSPVDLPLDGADPFSPTAEPTGSTGSYDLVAAPVESIDQHATEETHTQST